MSISSSNSISSNTKFLQGNSNNKIKENKIFFDIQKELEIIANTGIPNYSWKDLKPYIINYYKQNMDLFPLNNIISIDLGYINSGSKINNENNNRNVNKLNEEMKNQNNDNKKNKIDEDNNKEINENKISCDDNEESINNQIKEKINNDEENKEDNFPAKSTNIDSNIISFIDRMNIMPFTIQRIAELLLSPKRYYSSSKTYNKAFFKLVNIDLD